MAKVLLNHAFVDETEAKISPMDRGFLFGDGIYEVIPCYGGKPVGLKLHLARMNAGLREIGIEYVADEQQWLDHIQRLLSQYDAPSMGVYIHISRGADTKRFHAYPKGVQPTVFAYAFNIPPSQDLNRDTAKGFKVRTAEDLRWQRCHIKSTSLLGNVMHFQQGQDAGKDEVILYNKRREITEAAACNVFVVKDDVIYTPPLDNQLLPGITRRILLDSLAHAGGFDVREQTIELSILDECDEAWLSSSSKEIGAIVEIDGRMIGDGRPGPMWLAAQRAYNEYKFSC
ncbi:aminotransferase class IV [Glaciecola siphonariae]|uniref:Aminotransferase class IV n=1 Tax=Glaciecola siphonariae TaxID=521012 RepID=A0ABV9LTP7_9ALTE